MALANVTAAQTPPRTDPPCAACITLVVEPGQTLALSAPLNGLALAVRVPAGGEQAALPALEAIRQSGGLPALLIVGVPSGVIDPAVARLPSELFLDITSSPVPGAGPLDELAFRLKSRLTELRAASPALKLGLVATEVQTAALRSRDVDPYLDYIAHRAAQGIRRPIWPTSGEPYAMVFHAEADEQKPSTGQAVRWLWLAPPDVLAAAALARDLSSAMPFLGADLVAGGTTAIACGGRPLPTYLNPKTLDTIALATGCHDGTIELRPASASAERVRLSTGDVIVRVPAVEGVFADDVRVVAARELTVQEVVARHQAAAARQKAAVQTLISKGSMTLTFEAPGFPAPVAISSEAVIYEGLGRTEIEQRSIRVNGLEFKAGGVPRLPIIEPERVASPPLAITLSDMYRYSLAGRDRIGNTACYVVAFEPLDDKRALFRGRAWIAADSFAMIRVAAVQTGLRGPIVASEQVDEFEPVRRDVWLVKRSEIRQIYEGAGHRTPIHRVLTIASHEINPADFLSRRALAYGSGTVMLRDTPQGFRYLRRERGGDASGEVAPVVSGAASRVRTLALGVIVDPNISRPLPFAGLSYVDFNLFGTGAQINAFFGGTYGQLAFSVPSLGGSGWQLAGRAFGIASSYNDRAFENGREIYERNIRQRPAHASAWVLRPLTPSLTLRAGYELDYTDFGAADGTSSSFRVPADQVAHSARFALEGQQGGWNGALWWAAVRRTGWRGWGIDPGDYAPRHADYQRYGASVTRPFVITPALVARVEAAWMGGRDLDRFSRYAFGTFDNRLRGYPSALIRYDRGGVARTAAAWSAGRRLRVDGFLDTAYVHDPGFGRRLRSYTGAGAAVEAPAPFGMLTAVEWGYGFQGVNANGRRGTQVVRVSAFKIF